MHCIDKSNLLLCGLKKKLFSKHLQREMCIFTWSFEKHMLASVLIWNTLSCNINNET